MLTNYFRGPLRPRPAWLNVPVSPATPAKPDRAPAVTGPGDTPARTRSRTRASLSTEAIVTTAMQLIEEHGGTGLSVRRLGAALGCDPTAVYRHFPSMDALLLAVGDRLISQALARYEPGEDWRENLRLLANCTYAAYLAHPRVAILVAARVTGGEHETKVIDTVLGELRRAGFAGEQAVRLYRTFGDTVLAFSAVDAEYLASSPESRTADLHRWQEAYGAVDPERYPNLAALAPTVIEHADVHSFELCLDLLIDTFERLAPKG